MNGVNDDGHAGPAGGETAQDSGLAAVGVDNVGRAVSEKPGQIAKGKGVVPRVQRALKVRLDHKVPPAQPEPRDRKEQLVRRA